MALFLVALAAVLALGACTPAPPEEGINDPYEAANRSVHAFNRGLDRVLIRPASNTYGTILPPPFQTGVSNLSSNLSLPGVIVNDLLQAEIEDAFHNSARFLVNSTLGIGGLFDPAASDFDLPERESDFGETLYVWGLGEGAYIELPFFGPSNQRDAIGLIVDLVGNPVGFVLQSPESYVSPAATLGSVLGDRYTFAGTIDAVLYESADSYAQARILYLDSRRFELEGSVEPDYFDPYEEFSQ